ncbi:hypothetical protein SSX86_019247 [Deinandra increscens subsp. villosa]|uniref:Arabidopsis retrotransposon Orf1 C-terminal domain-containing protein n=1 Tax=Deinandra increscens subsp. villosa TaxID=3103831 RepID=A0AAP0CXE2_9ASTR
MQQDQDVNPHNTNLEYGQQSDPNFDQGQSLPYYGQQSYVGQPDYTQQSYGGFCLYGSQLQFGYGQPPYQLKNEPHYSQSSYGSEGETDFVDDSDEFVEDTYGGDDAEESGSSINTNSDGTETGDESDQDPETISYATNRAFASREDLQKWAKDRGRKYGFVIVIGRSRPNESVELLCDRGPKRPSTAKVRNTGSIKNDCAFKLVGRYNGRSDCWSLEEICKLHNHKPVVFEEGHPYLRRLTPEQSDFVGTLYKLHVRPRNILLALREKFPGSCCIIKDIYNVTRKIREQDKVAIWQYIQNNWLVPYKDKFVTCWCDGRLNFGQHTTNRVEGQHANLKDHIKGMNNTLDAIARLVDKVVRTQEIEISKTFEGSGIKLYNSHNHELYKNLHYKVTTEALRLIRREEKQLEKLRKAGATCGHQLFTSMGLPCACRLEQYIKKEMAEDDIHDDLFGEEMDDQPPQQRRRVDEHIGTLDLNEHLQFPEGNALKRYRKLRTMIPYRNTLIDWTLLETTDGDHMLTPPPPDQSDDDAVDPPEIRFNMFGYQHQMDLPEFAWRTGLYTEAEVQQPLFTESIHTLPDDELKNFWPAIGDRHLAGDSKASDIRDPLYRYFHRLIACGINGRKDSTDKCNFRDVFYLRCLLTHRRCNLARCLAAYSSSYYHRQSRGSLLGGPYVTRIAHSYAYILNLHQLRISPVPPMPCGVPTVRGMGMYAVFPGIGPRLRTRKDAPPYVPVPLVEPDPLNAPEIQIDGDQPVHEEDPPQHPAIIYRVARLPPATQALLQRLDQRSEQLSREIVEMRHMMSWHLASIGENRKESHSL